MRTPLKSVIFILVLSVLGIQSIYSQSDKDWWNSLSPAWKKIFQKQELKGKERDPSDEELGRIVTIVQIDCSNNKEIENLEPLARLVLLEEIRCNNTSIKSLKGIENLQNLKVLDCSDNDNINSLIPISKLTNLEKLNCGNTMVKDLKPIAGLTKLKFLDLHFCTVNFLMFIQNLTNLQKLDVSRNQSLFALNGIEKLTKLTEFNCSDTKVSDIQPISGLTNLEVIDISKTSIQTLRPLQGLKNLKEINFSETLIKGSSLDYLLGIPYLEMIRSKNNDITTEEKDAFEVYIKRRNPNCTILITPKSK